MWIFYMFTVAEICQLISIIDILVPHTNFNKSENVSKCTGYNRIKTFGIIAIEMRGNIIFILASIIVTPYGVTELGQYRVRYWLLSDGTKWLPAFYGIHLRAISQEMHKNLFLIWAWKLLVKDYSRISQGRWLKSSSKFGERFSS